MKSEHQHLDDNGHVIIDTTQTQINFKNSMILIIYILIVPLLRIYREPTTLSTSK